MNRLIIALVASLFAMSVYAAKEEKVNCNKAGAEEEKVAIAAAKEAKEAGMAACAAGAKEDKKVCERAAKDGEKAALRTAKEAKRKAEAECKAAQKK